eukprot:m.141263 g.141263  ORF g.141263 m.141263 type:complete len:102 (+) comp14843_c0_seq2:882-1187(+)
MNQVLHDIKSRIRQDAIRIVEAESSRQIADALEKPLDTDARQCPTFAKLSNSIVSTHLCTSCKAELPSIFFSRTQLQKLGSRIRCRACTAEGAMARYERQH